MQSKKSKVNKIKKCLKNGVPVAVIAVGIIAVCSGCDEAAVGERTSGIMIKPDEIKSSN